jgi:hypothetical protein
LSTDKSYPYNMLLSAIDAWVDKTVLLARCKNTWVKIKGYAWVMAAVDYNLRESSIPERHEEIMSLVWEDIGAAFRGQGDHITTALVVELFSTLTDEQQFALKLTIVKALTEASEFCEKNSITQRYGPAERAEAIISSYEHVRDHPDYCFDKRMENKATLREVIAVLNKAVKSKAAEASNSTRGVSSVQRLLQRAQELNLSRASPLDRHKLQLVVTDEQPAE